MQHQTPTQCIQSGDIHISSSPQDSLPRRPSRTTVCSSSPRREPPSALARQPCFLFDKRSARYRENTEEGGGGYVPTAFCNPYTPCIQPSVTALLPRAHRLLEEITAHGPLAAIALQAPDTLVRRLLTRVEILAVRFAVGSSACVLLLLLRAAVWRSSGCGRCVCACVLFELGGGWA